MGVRACRPFALRPNFKTSELQNFRTLTSGLPNFIPSELSEPLNSQGGGYLSGGVYPLRTPSSTLQTTTKIFTGGLFEIFSFSRLDVWTFRRLDI